MLRQLLLGMRHQRQSLSTISAAPAVSHATPAPAAYAAPCLASRADGLKGPSNLRTPAQPLPVPLATSDPDVVSSLSSPAGLDDDDRVAVAALNTVCSCVAGTFSRAPLCDPWGDPKRGLSQGAPRERRVPLSLHFPATQDMADVLQ